MQFFSLRYKHAQAPYQRHGGFSLVEMVLYIGLLSVLTVLIVNTSIQMMQSFAHFQMVRELNTTAVSIMDRLSRDVHLAYQVDQVQSSFGVNPGVLVLNLSTGGTRKYQVSGGQVQIVEDGASIGYLGSKNISVDILTFNLLQNTHTEAVKIRLELTATHKDQSITKTFYLTSILRDSY